MRKVKWVAAAALVGGCTLLMQPGYAQFAGLSNPLSKGAKSDAAPAGDPEKSLTALNVRFAVAMREMLTAEAFTLEALGDKAKADQLSETAKPTVSAVAAPSGKGKAHASAPAGHAQSQEGVDY